MTDGKDQLRYGWFEYREAPRQIANYLTGQKLTVVAGDVPALGELTCRYSDGEIEQTLRVFVDGKPRAPLELNYALTFSSPPDYGRWRRIDDFTTDALLCWPEFVFLEKWFALSVVGGWRSGTWQPNLKRTFSGRKSGTPEDMKKFPIADPHVIPLDTPAPKRWRYSDCETPAPEADLDFKREPPAYMPYLDAAEPVRGFQGRVPFLEREDAGAYLFPSRLQPDSHRGEDPIARLWYTYVDEHVFFDFCDSPIYQVELGYCHTYGYRKLPPAKALWATDHWGRPVPWDTPRPAPGRSSMGLHLPYRIWLEALAAVGDAWPAWRVPGRKIEIDPSVAVPRWKGRSTHVGGCGPTIHYGFSAGMKNTSFNLDYSTA